MLAAAVAQLRVAAAAVRGRPVPVSALDRLTAAALATRREFGSLGPDGADVVAGPPLTRTRLRGHPHPRSHPVTTRIFVGTRTANGHAPWSFGWRGRLSVSLGGPAGRSPAGGGNRTLTASSARRTGIASQAVADPRQNRHAFCGGATDPKRTGASGGQDATPCAGSQPGSTPGVQHPSTHSLSAIAPGGQQTIAQFGSSQQSPTGGSPRQTVPAVQQRHVPSTQRR
jgi:hypothetical protein